MKPKEKSIYPLLLKPIYPIHRTLPNIDIMTSGKESKHVYF
jgi:hypothetical protein